MIKLQYIIVNFRNYIKWKIIINLKEIYVATI